MSGLVPWARGQGVYPTQASTYALTRPQEVGLTAPTVPSFRDWWRELRETTIVADPPSPVQSAIVGLRQNAEAGVVGALLALIDTDLGGLDLGGRIPIDWVGAALFYALSIQDAGKHDSLSLDYRAMGQSCTSVATYRMVHKWRESKKGIPQNTPQMSGDPVLAAGKSKF
jgi:hypothetical protein